MPGFREIHLDCRPRQIFWRTAIPFDVKLSFGALLDMLWFQLPRG
jgi:hypothetical protein